MVSQAQFSSIRCQNNDPLDDIHDNCDPCSALLELSYNPSVVLDQSPRKGRPNNLIQNGELIILISTAHSLKFTEFETKTTTHQVPYVGLVQTQAPKKCADDFESVKKYSLGQ